MVRHTGRFAFDGIDLAGVLKFYIYIGDIAPEVRTPVPAASNAHTGDVTFRQYLES